MVFFPGKKSSLNYHKLTFQVLESIPQIPIHVKEIKKLILKDSTSTEPGVDDNLLLSILTTGSTGRNPTFFKAYGHENVFGLKSAIPEGAMELAETVQPRSESAEAPSAAATVANNSENDVLYVQLPDGHPVITGAEEEKPQQPEFNIEEAIEQAEIIFDDGPASINEDKAGDNNEAKPQVDETPPKTNHHNLRPKRTLRHVQALKQQAKRRKRNANVSAAVSASPVMQKVCKKPTVLNNGDFFIKFKPNAGGLNSELKTMKDVLQSIPGFSLSKIRKKTSNKKLSAAAAIQQAHEGIVDLESQDSIVGQVNVRSLLNKNTFQKLPAEYQYKLSQLLPQVDRVEDLSQNSVR